MLFRSGMNVKDRIADTDVVDILAHTRCLQSFGTEFCMLTGSGPAKTSSIISNSLICMEGTDHLVLTLALMAQLQEKFKNVFAVLIWFRSISTSPIISFISNFPIHSSSLIPNLKKLIQPLCR